MFNAPLGHVDQIANAHREDQGRVRTVRPTRSTFSLRLEANVYHSVAPAPENTPRSVS